MHASQAFSENTKPLARAPTTEKSAPVEQVRRIDLFLRRYDRERKLRAGAKFPVLFQFSFRKTEDPLARGKRDGHDRRIPRQKRIFEFYVVQSRIHRRRTLGIGNQQDRRLRDHLALNDAGHDRIAGKMPLQKEFVAANGVFPDRRAVLIQLHFVQKQHGFAMGQKLFDLLSVHDASSADNAVIGVLIFGEQRPAHNGQNDGRSKR